MQRTACVWKQTSPLINKDECLSDKLPIFSCVCTNRPPPSLPRLALFLPAGERRSGKCGSSYRSDLSSHYLRACAAAAFAKRHYSMNKYALAPVCVSPQRFYHRSSRARSLCKLLSVKKAQGKRKKNREGWSWGGIEEALSKHLRSDKSISVFNRVEEMCGRCGARGWESAKHRVESVTERLSGDKWSTTQSYYVDSSKIPHKYSDTASPPTSLQTFHFFKMLAAARLADMS